MQGATMMRLLAACAALLVSLPAAHAEESPRHVNAEFKIASYTPGIDGEFGGTATPYHDVFGGAIFPLFQVRADYLFLSGVWGTLGAGAGIGYGGKSGHGRLADGTASSDSTGLHLMPVDGGLFYEFDWLAQRYSIPVVPYGRVDLTYTIWWFTNGIGDVTDFSDPKTGDDALGYGGTWGVRAGGGLRLLLDVFAPMMARTFDVDFGVNNSYLFVEYMWSKVDDFGSGSSLHLGDSGYLNFGIAFEF